MVEAVLSFLQVFAFAGYMRDTWDKNTPNFQQLLQKALLGMSPMLIGSLEIHEPSLPAGDFFQALQQIYLQIDWWGIFYF